MAADYQVAVSYNGKKLIPGPFIQMTRDYQRSPDGTVRLRTWKVTVKGKAAAFAGSPDYTGAFWTASGYPPDPNPSFNIPSLRFKNLEAKLGAIETLFNEDGHWFEIQPGDGSAPIKFQPRIESIDFAEGPWFNVVDFTIQMETDCIHFGNLEDSTCEYNAANNPAEETWTLEPADDFRPTWRLHHAVSAQAHNKFSDDGSGTVESNGWQLAKISVDAALGYSAAFGLVGYSPYNYHKSTTSDKSAGKYSANEDWVLSQFNYTQDTSSETSFSTESGFSSVKVSGTIAGFQDGTDPTTRFTNAQTRATAVTDDASLLNTAQSESGLSVNPIALTKSIGKNKPQGTISYSAEFNTRPATTSGLLTETVSVSIDHATPVVAQIGVINRSYGPVLQPIGSYTQKSCTIQADTSVLVAYGQAEPAIPSYDTLAKFVQYVGSPPTVYVQNDKENWYPKTGRYSRTTVYIYQDI